MICKNCGTEVNPDAKFCLGCGAPVEFSYEPPAPLMPNVVIQNTIPQSEEYLPEKYRPLGAWTYFALQLLFAIPIVGFVFLIVFSFSSGNINRRSFARSYWCSLLVFSVIAIIAIIIIVLLGGSAALLSAR